MATSGKKKARSTSRGWWWEEFTEHPGYENHAQESMVQQKAKLICSRQLERYLAEELARDEREVRQGFRNHIRDEDAIKGAVWATGQQDAHRPQTLLTHIRDCELHAESVRLRARADLAKYISPKKSARFGQGMQLEPLQAPLLPVSLPQSYAVPSQIAGPSATSAFTSPSLSLTIPGLPVSTTSTGSGSFGLLSLPSPVVESCAPSPAMSNISLMSIPSKRQRITQSGLYRSISQPATTMSGSFSPHISVHWPTGQPWTDADQADWEAGLARVTASAGLPLRWVENPEWVKLCDRFIPRAKIPSAKVLTKRVMPHVLQGLKVMAKEECRGAVATLQCDGWTGENSHHLLGFMMTSRRKLYAIRVHDASGDARNAEELLKQIIESINIIESEWGVTVIACTTDASGESRKAWRLLRAQFPHMVTPDCLAHQFNLIVGDLFKAKNNYGQYSDHAQELITWLHSKTHVLALLRELQMSTMGKTLAIIRAVLTRWLSHYLAYRRLLEVRPTLELLITKHEADLQSTGNAQSRAKTLAAITIIRNPMFWHAMARWKNLLEPIALMTNIHQAAHSRPENVPISFGFLYYRYSRIGDDMDLDARNAVLESAECRWAQVDQEVFIAAVILNPLYKDKPFNSIALTTRAGLMSLFSRLWKRFYGGTPPLELFTDLDNYLKSSPEFEPIDIYTQILLSRAKEKDTSVDPLDIWDGFSHSNSVIKPLQKIAQHVLSICPNSASCERLFSMFGAILTKWRNRLSTKNLMLLAELKMYLHEEHVRTGSISKRLKRRYCSGPNENSQVEQPPEVLEPHATCTENDSDSDADTSGGSHQSSAMVQESRGLRRIAAHLIRVVADEESLLASEVAHAANNPAIFQKIPIKDLFDFTRAEDWLGSFFHTAIRGLDAEVELYELLDLDAEGIDDPEFPSPQADEILDE